MIRGMLVTLLLTLSLTANAITISDEQVKGPMKFFALSGEFTQDSKDVLLTFLEQNPQELNLMMHSPGGFAGHLVEMMQAMHDHGQVRVIVTPANICLSACAFVASAAMQVYGKLHYHAVYASPEQLAKKGDLTHFEQQMLNSELHASNSRLGYIMEDILKIPKMIVRSVVVEKAGWVIVEYRGSVTLPISFTHVPHDSPVENMIEYRKKLN